MTGPVDAGPPRRCVIDASVGIKLISADKRLVHSFHGSPFEVRWLGDLPTQLPTG